MKKRQWYKIIVFAVVCFIAGSLLGPEGLAKGYAGEAESGTLYDSGMLTEVQADPMEAFVTRMYRVILEREPDAGSATWVNGLKDGSFTGVRVADGFVLSEEMLNKDISNEEFVKILYHAFFGREADEGGLATWKGLLDNGCKKTYVFAGFANSTEFGNLCAEAGIVQGRAAEYLADRQTGLSDADYKIWCFVERMYTEVLGRTADESGVRTWVGVLQDGSYTGVEVADGFLLSEEFLAKNMTDEEYVQIMYRAFFGRNADPEGLATWTGALATGWTKQRVFAGFANSNEFGVLCEQAGIVKGTAEVTAAAPEKPYKIVNEVEGVHLFWNPVEGVTQYGVWRREEGVQGAYGFLDNVSGTEFVDTTAQSGKSYYYGISFYDVEKQSHSSLSETVNIIFIAAPEITACYNDDYGITLEWSKVEGATEYEIQRWDDLNQYWQRAGIIRNLDTLKWTDETSAYQHGKVYKYSIYAGNGSERNDSGIREEGAEITRLRGLFDAVFIPRLNSAYYELYFGNYMDGKWIEADGYQLRILQNSVEHKIESISPYKSAHNTSHAERMVGIVRNKVFRSLDASKGKITIQLRYYKEIENMGTVYSSWGDEIEVVSHDALEARLNEIATTITASADTDLEKAIAVYDWVVDNVGYQYGTGHEDQCFENAIINGYAVCGGFANTFLTLAERVGLEAIYVSGEHVDPTEDPHAWNQVKIDGQWYNLDVTWGDNTWSTKDTFEEYILRFYQFLLSDETFNKNHGVYCVNRSEEYECPEDFDISDYIVCREKGEHAIFAGDEEELVSKIEQKLQDGYDVCEFWYFDYDNGYNYDGRLSTFDDIKILLNLQCDLAEPAYRVVNVEQFWTGYLGSLSVIAGKIERRGYDTESVPEGTTCIEKKAFADRDDIEYIALPEGLLSIGEQAFLRCKNLARIQLPESLLSIGVGAFRECSKLKRIEIPENIAVIEAQTFMGCGLEMVELPDGITTIGKSAFSSCDLKNLKLPDSLTVIGENAFEYCMDIEELTMPKSLLTIGKWAFIGCNDLRRVELQEGVTTIGFAAFAKCKNLEEITIPASVTTIEENAFDGCPNLTIRCKAGSYAETYAIESGIAYVTE